VGVGSGAIRSAGCGISRTSGAFSPGVGVAVAAEDAGAGTERDAVSHAAAAKNTAGTRARGIRRTAKL
jgi:hypothetical protein